MLGIPLLSLVYPAMGFILLRHPAARRHSARPFLWIFNVANLLPLAIPLLRMFSIARDWGPLPVGFVFLVMEYIVSLCALKIRLSPVKQRDIPANVPEGGGSDAERGPGKYEKTGLSETEARQLADRLVSFMNREKPYLDDELDVVALANSLNVSRHHLSQVLSKTLGKNFYSYVNELRIAEVQRQMADPAFRDHSIFRIAMSCGFSSKSTFNSVFKSITGMTPNEYRRPHQQENKEVS
ncbi:MAG: helix-turn-helix transcriptional regulator [Leptospirales bacterium]|nr:helix-turn-helix transcriptional regulator [Leptospirales bacterium]